MGTINRDDMLELTRRMTLKRNALTGSPVRIWIKMDLWTGPLIKISVSFPCRISKRTLISRR